MHTLYRYFIVFTVVFTLCTIAHTQPANMLDITLNVSPHSARIIVHFNNKGSTPLRLWGDGNSWGWDNVRFIIIRNNVPFYFRRNPDEMFTRNGPGYDEVGKLKSLDRAFDLSDGSWITSKNAPKEILRSDTVICTYAINSTPAAAKYDVWIGTACGVNGLLYANQ